MDVTKRKCSHVMQLIHVCQRCISNEIFKISIMCYSIRGTPRIMYDWKAYYLRCLSKIRLSLGLTFFRRRAFDIYKLETLVDCISCTYVLYKIAHTKWIILAVRDVKKLLFFRTDVRAEILVARMITRDFIGDKHFV